MLWKSQYRSRSRLNEHDANGEYDDGEYRRLNTALAVD